MCLYLAVFLALVDPAGLLYGYSAAAVSSHCLIPNRALHSDATSPRVCRGSYHALEQPYLAPRSPRWVILA
jgi:hypothetical protein